jgi:tetratricopeptide (TPR) repeat protein
MNKVLCSLLVVAAASTSSLADDKADKAKAKALYDEGLKHYNLAEWPDAIKAWKESYILSKKPLLLFNIGQAYRLAGDCKQAQTFYDSYQREEPNPKNQSELDEAIAICAKQGDAKPPEKPIEKPVTPVVTKPDTSNPATPGPTVAQGGDAASMPNPDRQPVDTGPQMTGGTVRLVGIGVGGAGVVMLGAGIYFALGARSAANEIDGYTGEWGPDQQAIEDRGEKKQKNAFIFGGIGLAAAIAGGVMFAIGGPKTTEASTVTIVPTNGGAGVGWAGRF